MTPLQTPSSLTAQPESLRQLLPRATLLRLLVAWLVVLAFQLGGAGWLAEPVAVGVAVPCFVSLFATILHAAFGVVREADQLADRLGEPYGTLILTLSIVSIEVILIAAVMLGPGETPIIGRDSIFAVMMIILNLVMGLCLLLGGLRYGEQEYNAQGAVAYLSMIVLLTTLALVLPNATSAGGGRLLPLQAWALGGLTLALYGAFLAMQMRGYRRFFVQPEQGSMAVPFNLPQEGRGPVARPGPGFVDRRSLVLRSLILLALMLPIVLLAGHLAVLIDLGVEYAGAPVAVGGLLIAIIVFTPESITAVKAALANQAQRAVNLCLGAFVSTVGLTVPAVLLIGLLTGQTVVFGLDALDTVLLAITLALTTLSFLGARTSPIQGLMHLMLFAVYAVLLFVP